MISASNNLSKSYHNKIVYLVVRIWVTSLNMIYHCSFSSCSHPGVRKYLLISNFRKRLARLTSGANRRKSVWFSTFLSSFFFLLIFQSTLPRNMGKGMFPNAPELRFVSHFSSSIQGRTNSMYVRKPSISLSINLLRDGAICTPY